MPHPKNAYKACVNLSGYPITPGQEMISIKELQTLDLSFNSMGLFFRSWSLQFSLVVLHAISEILFPLVVHSTFSEIVVKIER